MPAKARIVVVFPAPFCPTIPRISPGADAEREPPDGDGVAIRLMEILDDDRHRNCLFGAFRISDFPPPGGGIEGGRDSGPAGRTRIPSDSPFEREKVLSDAPTNSRQPATAATSAPATSPP